MRIKQACASPVYEERIYKKFSLGPYIKKDEPVVFFGCHYDHVVKAAGEHESTAVIVWTGSDTMLLRQELEGRADFSYLSIIGKKNIQHVAVSPDTVKDLSALGVPHIYLPICDADANMYQPVKLGMKVMTYTNPRKDETLVWLYGKDIVDIVDKALPDIEFILTHWCKYKRKDMPKLYSQCFIGLRPTRHDGGSNMVLEMGLMGIRSIHNGNSPAAIPWKSPTDIIVNIRKEYGQVGIINQKLAEEMRTFLDVGEDWLDTEWYKK